MTRGIVRPVTDVSLRPIRIGVGLTFVIVAEPVMWRLQTSTWSHCKQGDGSGPGHHGWIPRKVAKASGELGLPAEEGELSIDNRVSRFIHPMALPGMQPLTWGLANVLSNAAPRPT